MNKPKQNMYPSSNPEKQQHKWPALSNFHGGAWGLVRKMLASLWCQDSHLHTWVATHESLMWVADDKDCTWQEQGANWPGTQNWVPSSDVHPILFIRWIQETQSINNLQIRDNRYRDTGKISNNSNDVNITCCTFVLTKPFWKIYNMVIFDKVNLFEVWDNKIRLQVVNSKGRILCILHKNNS